MVVTAEFLSNADFSGTYQDMIFYKFQTLSLLSKSIGPGI
jgi:hypothetical protein